MNSLNTAVTNVSLKEIDGSPAIVWSGIALHAREKYTDGSDDSQERLTGKSSYGVTSLAPSEDFDGYRLLPNANTAAKLLKACEGFDHPLIPQALSGTYIRESNASVSEIVGPKELLGAFLAGRPTRTQVRDAKKVIENWCYQSDISSAIPVKDLLAMLGDLRAIITMLLFAVGDACTPQKLKENTAGGLKLFNVEAEGCDCYRRHIEAIPDYRMPGGIDGMKQEYELHIAPLIKSASPEVARDAAAHETIRGYCNVLISALMSSLTPVLTFDGFYAGNQFASLGGAYAFWAYESIIGKAAVCEHCGDLFIRKRSSGRFCKPACRVAAYDAAKN